MHVPVKTELHQPPGFRNISASIAASDVYECILAVKPSICSHIPLECAGGGHIKLTAIMSIIRIISIIFIAIIVIMDIKCREKDNEYNRMGKS
jgi:hypothetical protein